MVWVCSVKDTVPWLGITEVFVHVAVQSVMENDGSAADSSGPAVIAADKDVTVDNLKVRL